MSTTDPQVRYCTTSDGVQIAYVVDGSGPGIPVICMGAPFTDVRPSYWEEFGLTTIGGVSRDARPVAWFDFRGCGISERNVEDVSMDALELDLYAVIERLDWPRFSLMAMAMTGPLVMKYAAEHPDRVASLVLRETYARAAEMGRIPRMRALGLLLREDYESYMMLMVATNGWLSEGARLMKLFAGATTEEMCRMYAAASPTFNANMFVDKIQARTLVIGRDDMPVPSGDMLRQLGGRIRDARVVMEAGGFARDGPAVEQFLAEDDPGAAAPAPTTPTGTRTVLFTDIVGHTEMMQRLGDAKGRDVLREHERITRETLKQHGGAEVKTMGDGFMASFGSVTSAMECAIALQRAFAAHTDSMPEPLHVRVGLNAGEPIEEDGDLFGATVILASRIAAKAGAGEILVPDTVRGLLSGKGFVFGDRGEFVPKGFDEGVRLWDVRWRE